MKSIALLISLFFLSSCSILNNTWQGSFYRNGDTGLSPEYSPVFTNFSSCKKWVTDKAKSNDKYTCNKNCENIGSDSMQKCEIVVRNWIINEGTITFDNYKE